MLPSRVDYLEFTLHVSPAIGVGLAAQVVGDLTVRPGGWRGYPCSAEGASGGLVGWSPEDFNGARGVHISLSSAALPLDVVGLLHFIYSNSGRVTRLDVAFDDVEGLLSMRTLLRAFNRGDYACRAKSAVPGKRSSYRMYQSRYAGGRTGSTLYFGSAAADTVVRIYDKSAEQGTASHWIRVELQLRRDRADSLAREFWAREFLDFSLAQGVILSHLRFLPAARSDSNRSRSPVAAWWARMMGQRVYTLAPAAVASRTLEKVYAWFISTASRALAILNLWSPDSLYMLLDAGFKRIRQEDLRLIPGFSTI